MAQTNRKNYQRNNQNQQQRKPSTPHISAKIDKLLNSDGNTRAYASVNIAGAVAIHGLRVIDSRKGVFVSMPTRSYTDSNGNTQYSEIAHAVTKETREAINTKVLEAYNGQCLGMVYNGSLGIGNAGWFPPTDISGYTDTDAATAACYGDVDYVPYYYAGMGAEPSDIMFNVVASGGQIYVVYG